MAGEFPLCCVCNEPIFLLDNLSNIEGKLAHRRCVEEHKGKRSVGEDQNLASESKQTWQQPVGIKPSKSR